MKQYFDGTYYKHQKGEDTLSLIVGKTSSEEFIQVITKNQSYQVPEIGKTVFSKKGVKLNIHTDELDLEGKIRYHDLTPIRYDIMGPFRYFPMECRHGIISMHHRLDGKVVLNGEEIDFTNGTGYIEKDSGTSFPSSYLWIQSNDFPEKCSYVVSIATIPFLCGTFQGMICIIYDKGKEYRLATYLGGKVLSWNQHEVIIKQGKYRLVLKINPQKGHQLKAPSRGKMTRKIIESLSCEAELVFYKKGAEILHLHSGHASFECEISEKDVNRLEITR